jgi:two-component system cell cycle sensor histidine kinase/response regulator CckA
MTSSIALVPGDGPLKLSRPRSGATILLVEDEKPLAELVSNLLARLNLLILVAPDGISALNLFNEHSDSITLAFVDCNLPDIPGPKLCEKMRERVPRLPLLLTSGRNQDTLENMFTEGGPCSFLPKPYLPAEVLRRVSALLASSV